MTANFDLVCLKVDKRRLEYGLWSKWLSEAATIAARFWSEYEDDPFSYGEQASMGVLATAAARAGFLAMPEFAIDKQSRVDGRRTVRGRSDLWIGDDKADWWFEAKQHSVSRGSDRDLQRKWDAAEACAKQMRRNGTAVAMLVVSSGWIQRERPDKIADARAALARFTNDRQFAYRIGEGTETPETYIFLDVVRADR